MFDKSLLPSPRTFYEAAIGRLTRANSKGWSLGNCVFHASKSKKSFSVNIRSGAFHCFGCDASGGGVVVFVMRRDGLNFKQACRRLGCWEENGKPVKPRPGPQVRYLVMDFAVDGVEYRAEVRDEPKTELERLRWSYAEAADRLAEIRNGATEKFEGEAEVQWGILADNWELIQMEAADGQ